MFIRERGSGSNAAIAGSEQALHMHRTTSSFIPMLLARMLSSRFNISRETSPILADEIDAGLGSTGGWRYHDRLRTQN